MPFNYDIMLIEWIDNMKNKKILIIILFLLAIVGCGKQKVKTYDPDVEYKSFYDGSYGNAGKLKGTTVVVSIFTDDKNTSWDLKKANKKDKKQIISKLKTATKYLEDSASKYDSDVSFIYDFNAYPDLFYEVEFTQNLLTEKNTYYETQVSYIKKYIDSDYLKNKFHADNIIYLFFLNTDYENKIKPWTMAHNNCPNCLVEFSNIFYRFKDMVVPTSTIAHEMMHQFGAPDFYISNQTIPDEYVKHLEKEKSKDIMFYVNTGNKINSKFTALDAYYVGIGKRPSEADKWNLGLSEYERG